MYLFPALDRLSWTIAAGSSPQLCKGKASRGQQRNRTRLLGRETTGAELCFDDMAIPLGTTVFISFPKYFRQQGPVLLRGRKAPPADGCVFSRSMWLCLPCAASRGSASLTRPAASQRKWR